MKCEWVIAASLMLGVCGGTSQSENGDSLEITIRICDEDGRPLPESFVANIGTGGVHSTDTAVRETDTNGLVRIAVSNGTYLYITSPGWKSVVTNSLAAKAGQTNVITLRKETMKREQAGLRLDGVLPKPPH